MEHLIITRIVTSVPVASIYVTQTAILYLRNVPTYKSRQPRLLAMRKMLKLPVNKDNVRLDALFAKSLTSFVKMKVRRGQAGVDPWLPD